MVSKSDDIRTPVLLDMVVRSISKHN